MSLLKLITSQEARVGVIGLGYVGLPLAVTAAHKGFPVTGFDVDPGKMEKLDAGESYIGAVTNDSLNEVIKAGRFDWTTDFSGLADCDVIIICVPTPLTKQREPDLSFVEATALEISRHIRRDTLVVLESTTYPGTTAEILGPLLSESGLVLGREIFTAFSPEREDPGNTSYRTQTIPKIVAGDGEAAREVAVAFYERVVDSVVSVSTTQTAEAIKITENIFRAVNIALVNELKLIFDKMGIDVWEVIDGAATKPFGFMPFYPGPGLGGHCIPIDPYYLTWKAREFDVPTRFIELAGEINTNMPMHVIDRLREIVDRQCAKGLSSAYILLVGVSYKKNVSDMRESPSMRLMQLLDDAGARVDFLDPHVPEIPATREYSQFTGDRAIDAGDIADKGFDAVLISTDHDAIDYDALAQLGIPIIDTRNAMERRGVSTKRVTKV